MNPQQMPRRPQPIAQSETRLPHRPPLGQRVLADAAGELAVRTELPETQIQLDVEQPGRHEVIGKERVDRFRPEDLGPTLGVVRVKTQEEAGSGHEQATEHVTREASLDPRAEPHHTDSGDTDELRVVLQNVDERVDLRQRRGQVGVPEADQVALGFLQDSSPDGARFAMAPVQTQHRDSRVLVGQPVEHAAGLIGAGIVNESQVSGRTGADPGQEGPRVEPCLLVVAGDDERE